MYIDRKEVFAAWLAEIRFYGFRSGQRLFDMLLDYGQGRFFIDSSDADALLREAEQKGQIQKAKNSRGEYTREFKTIQLFAGVGGLGPDHLKNADFPHFFGWEIPPTDLPDGWDAI
jgi:hypothetical protein